ncbi:AOC3 isoform 6, partial [Pan troglodytes]
YDYVWDTVFHPSGAIEIRFYATGYISSAFLFGATGKYGNQVSEHTLGTVHTHSAHFKVDLDVAGDPEAARDGGAGRLPRGKRHPSLPVPGQQPQQQVGSPPGLPHPDAQLCWRAAAPKQLHGERLQLGEVPAGCDPAEGGGAQ